MARPFEAIPFAIVGLLLATSANSRPPAVQIGGVLLLAACAGIALGMRRRELSPGVATILLAAESLLAFALWVSWPRAEGWILLTWVAGAAGGSLPHRSAVAILILIGALFLAGAQLTAGGPGQLGPNVAWLGLLLGAIFVIGVQRQGQREYVRRMEEMVVALRRYSEQLEDAHRQLRAESLQAAAEERNRIAREIHAVLAHSLTVIVVQAQAIRRLVRTDPEAAERQADTVATLAREGLQEARRSVAALRSQPADVDGLGTLRHLVEEFGRQTGTATTFAVQGAERPLSPNAWTTLYRVTQEGLTNARCHGQARSVAVRLAFGDAVRLTLEDDGAADPADGVTPGNGLTGMRERAERLGGRVSYGPRPDGGFHVALELPT